MFGGVTNHSMVPLRAANRVLVAAGKTGSLAVFTPPHTYFFTREVDTNLGYVWYRKDAAGRRRSASARPSVRRCNKYVDNFALFNAPPGTEQRMGVYFYASAERAEPTRQSVLAFTHGDTFKPVNGYKTMVNHFHLRFTERVRATKSFDSPIQDIAAMKALGLNIVGLSDFHGDLHANDAGALRFQDQRDYGEATRRASDADFLVTPWEEPSAYFGGHYNILVPEERLLDEGEEGGAAVHRGGCGVRAYHTGHAEDVQKMMDAEGAFWYHAHPRTKGTTGYPDLIFDKAWTKNDRISASRSSPAWAWIVRGANVRVAVLRRHRHDEQPVCGIGAAPEFTSSRTSTPTRRTRRTICIRTSR